MAPPAEISIPSTILSTGESKPYTLYNITLRLPLKSFVVQKRYSDFAALHQTLTSLVGSPPPKPLPGKSWFKSTVSSPDLTEQRRQGLETYLRAIAESPDRRWRDTSAWRSFLNLPALAPQPPAGAAAKKALVKAGTLLGTLTDGLRAMQESGRLGDGELRRRRDLLSAARGDREGLEKLSNSMAQGNGRAGGGGGGSREGWASAADKAALIGGGGGARPGGRVLGAPLPETQRTRELDNEGVVQLQRQMMSEQDEQVNVLASIVRRQKEMGLQINDEVQAQTAMLGRLDEDVDRVGGKINVAKNRIKKM
ncbi:Vacuolar morphogenesis protein 7-like protein [Colletotrichum chlorophyti]|uniref:Vacuolar morphogenesis protein 7-like protein n=1 Tax=Colletotrichum chlorophyti TaxID=708187 RepID=A0A1Q8RGA2_9PEZI|nr:Vacuolar morphogenesis protein 7-like protein [Colletotrichum chlorophyti]